MLNTLVNFPCLDQEHFMDQVENLAITPMISPSYYLLNAYHHSNLDEKGDLNQDPNDRDQLIKIEQTTNLGLINSHEKQTDKNINNNDNNNENDENLRESLNMDLQKKLTPNDMGVVRHIQDKEPYENNEYFSGDLYQNSSVKIQIQLDNNHTNNIGIAFGNDLNQQQSDQQHQMDAFLWESPTSQKRFKTYLNDSDSLRKNTNKRIDLIIKSVLRSIRRFFKQLFQQINNTHSLTFKEKSQQFHRHLERLVDHILENQVISQSLPNDLLTRKYSLQTSRQDLKDEISFLLGSLISPKQTMSLPEFQSRSSEIKAIHKTLNSYSNTQLQRLLSNYPSFGLLIKVAFQNSEQIISKLIKDKKWNDDFLTGFKFLINLIPQIKGKKLEKSDEENQ